MNTGVSTDLRAGDVVVLSHNAVDIAGRALGDSSMRVTKLHTFVAPTGELVVEGIDAVAFDPKEDAWWCATVAIEQVERSSPGTAIESLLSSIAHQAAHNARQLPRTALQRTVCTIEALHAVHGAWMGHGPFHIDVDGPITAGSQLWGPEPVSAGQRQRGGVVLSSHSRPRLTARVVQHSCDHGWVVEEVDATEMAIVAPSITEVRRLLRATTARLVREPNGGTSGGAAPRPAMWGRAHSNAWREALHVAVELAQIAEGLNQ